MSSTLVEQKEAEVQNLARKDGVERYLGTERLDDIQNIVEAWAEMSKESNVKAYSKVLENRSLIDRNYKMMQLYAPILSINAKKQIRETIKNPDLSFNKTELLKMMLKDGFGEINFSELFQNFNRISVDNR